MAIYDRKDEGMHKLQDGSITEVASNTTTTSQASGDQERTLWQNIKKYRKVVYITLGLTSAILLYGYDNVVVGTVSGMPPFQFVFAPFSIVHVQPINM